MAAVIIDKARRDMYKIDFTATAKKSVTLTLFALFLMMCIFSLMIGSSFHIAEPQTTYLGIDNSAATSSQRLDFLRALGYAPDPSGEESEEITIPAVFGDVYSRYNELQKLSGGDLLPYRGAVCTRFTYIDTETARRLDLIVYKGRIIGGDECTAALDGEMNELKAISSKLKA